MRFLCSACRTILTGEKGQEVECRLCKTICKAPAEPTAPGAVIGDFAIVREVARGGMGIVFLARQISLDRLVALKILQDSYAKDAQFVEDFIREARAAARISHPNIVQAYAVGEENGIYYFAMELIDGDTMKGVLKKEQKIAPRKAAEIIRSIADALDYAWTEQKIVHQDIKPDNIMLTRRGQAKLADLGLSRMATGSIDLNEDEDEVMGTPQYISPEQLTGMPTDIRSDIYSLGATFYHFITGEFPYKGKDGNEIARQHVEGTLVPPIEKIPDLPPELNRIIVKMMAKTLEERYQTGAELVEDLKNFLRGTPAPAQAETAPEAPKSPTVQAPKINAPAPQAPKINAPAPQAPKINAPAPQAPKINAPAPQAPKINVPAPQAPKLNTPAAPNAPETTKAPAAPKVAIPVVPKTPETTKAPAQETKPDLKLQKKEDGKTENLPPDAQQNQTDQKKKKRQMPRWAKWTISGVTGGLALLIITLAVLIYFRQMPSFMKPVEDQIFSIFNLTEQDGKLVRAGSAAQTPEARPAPAPKPRAPQPPPPPKPKTRPEFIKESQVLQQLASQGDVEKFLAGVDEFMLKYPNDQTPEEKSVRTDLLRDYGLNDEGLRVNPYRTQARAKREAAAEAAAEAARQKEEAEQKRKAEAERIAAEQRQKMDLAVREAQKEKSELMAQLQPRIEAYIAQKAGECRALAGAFFTELGQPDSARWEECQKAAMTAGTFPPDVQPAEKAAAQKAAAFARSLKTDFAVAGALKKAISDPAILQGIQLEVNQQLTRLERFAKPHTAIVRNTLTDKAFSLNLRKANQRKALLNKLIRNKQISAIYAKYPEKQRLILLSEHLDLVTADYERLLQKATPARKQLFSRLLEGYFADRMQNGTAEEKAMLEKDHGTLPEFRKAAGK